MLRREQTPNVLSTRKTWWPCDAGVVANAVVMRLCHLHASASQHLRKGLKIENFQVKISETLSKKLGPAEQYAETTLESWHQHQDRRDNCPQDARGRDTARRPQEGRQLAALGTGPLQHALQGQGHQARQGQTEATLKEGRRHLCQVEQRRPARLWRRHFNETCDSGRRGQVKACPRRAC